MLRRRPEAALPRRRQLKHRLVNLTFHQKTHKKIIDRINQKHKSIISQKEWTFNFQQYDVKEIKKLFEVTEKLLISDLSLHYCRKATILKQISFIDFSNMKRLYLCGNSIKNVQALGNLNAINLERLYLRKNYITSLRPFRKCNFKLKVLDMCQNRIVSLSNLWQNIDLSQIQQFIVNQNKQLCFTFCFVKAQLNYQNINLFWICSDGKMRLRSKTNLLWQLGVKNVRISH